MRPNWLIGLDMGGTNVRAAAVSRAGELLAMVRAPASAAASAGAIVENIVARVRESRGAGGRPAPGPARRHRHRRARSARSRGRTRDDGAARAGVAIMPVAFRFGLGSETV